MTDKTALRQLIEAVEAGQDPNELAAVMPDQRTTDLTYAAFRGSLDAAKALHDALLSGFRYEINRLSVAVENPHDARRYFGQKCQEGGPARLWLLAILKAYDAQQ